MFGDGNVFPVRAKPRRNDNSEELQMSLHPNRPKYLKFETPENEVLAKNKLKILQSKRRKFIRKFLLAP